MDECLIIGLSEGTADDGPDNFDSEGGRTTLRNCVAPAIAALFPITNLQQWIDLSA